MPPLEAFNVQPGNRLKTAEGEVDVVARFATEQGAALILQGVDSASTYVVLEGHFLDDGNDVEHVGTTADAKAQQAESDTPPTPTDTPVSPVSSEPPPTPTPEG